jgi:hypothetical protein
MPTADTRHQTRPQISVNGPAFVRLLFAGDFQRIALPFRLRSMQAAGERHPLSCAALRLKHE